VLFRSLSHIAHQEKIDVTEADLDAHIARVVDGAPADQKADVSKWMAERRESMQGQMREEKLFDFLIGQASVVDQ
jgi:FKBP-type peptidyl-prolyl cis-trans isomerase (trigger factor)